MELGPVFRSLMHNKGRFWLITFEIALTVAIVVNCATLMLGQYREMTRPTGMDEANILVVKRQAISADFKNEKYLQANIREDLRTLRAQQGVEAASVLSAIPLSGGGSATGRKRPGSKLDTSSTPYFVVRPDAVATLGVEIIEGRDLKASDFPADEESDTDAGKAPDPQDVLRRNALLTKHLADILYPDGDALGKQIVSGDDPPTQIDTVVGIIDRMQGSWPTSSVAEDVMILPGHPGSFQRVSYFVRARPEALTDLYTSLEETLVALNADRLVNVQTLEEIKEDTFSQNVAMMKLISGVIVLLFSVTSLGIVGLTSFSVTQRIRQIGTRRALGATKGSILRYFLVENWIITGIGLAIGIGLSVGLNQVLVVVADAPKLEWGLLATTLMLFWAVGLAAALLPAMRSMAVSPVVATRSV